MSVSFQFKRVMCAAVLLLFVIGLSRAANYRFRQQESDFRKAASEQLQKLGLTREAAKSKYPTPEIKMVSTACVLPGATSEVVVRGKFAPDTKFFFQNDNIEIVKESLASDVYRATVKAAAGIGPQSASLIALTPVTAISAQYSDAIKVGGRYEWNMEAANGWRVVARSRSTQPCGDTNSADSYELAFYKKGESTPFEKRNGRLQFSLWDSMNYRFNIERGSMPAVSGQETYQALMQKMADPNLSNAERGQLIQKLQKAAEAMQASMAKMADPANIKKMQDSELEFGCTGIDLEYHGGASFKGILRCSEKTGRRIALTGAMSALK